MDRWEAWKRIVADSSRNLAVVQQIYGEMRAALRRAQATGVVTLDQRLKMLVTAELCRKMQRRRMEAEARYQQALLSEEQPYEYR
jgi:hypothetical protein